MKRDDLIKLLLSEVPSDGDVRVCNSNIHDDKIRVEQFPRKKNFDRWEDGYFLLDGKTGL